MEKDISITRARHAWRERAEFTISRPIGLHEYTFLHFFNSVDLLTAEGTITTLPDSCILYAPGEPQWFRSPTELTHDWIHFNGEMGSILNAAGITTNQVYLPGNAKWITAITREIELEILAKATNYRQLTELKLQELLLKLGRSCKGHSGQHIKPELIEQLRNVRGQVFGMLERNWTITDMAALAYISPSRFHAVYRQLFGISPADDLIHARIDTAKSRLRDSREPIWQIAEELGYRNQTHFCRQFKQITGVTPGEYRKDT